MGVIADIQTLLIDIEPVIFFGDKPEAPDNLICLYESGGYAPQHSFGSKDYEQPTFQVRVRDTSYANGITRCEVIKDLLDGISGQIINSHTYISIFQQGDILPLGKDSKNRAEFSLNFQCKVRR